MSLFSNFRLSHTLFYQYLYTEVWKTIWIYHIQVLIDIYSISKWENIIIVDIIIVMYLWRNERQHTNKYRKSKKNKIKEKSKYSKLWNIKEHFNIYIYIYMHIQLYILAWNTKFKIVFYRLEWLGFWSVYVIPIVCKPFVLRRDWVKCKPFIRCKL